MSSTARLLAILIPVLSFLFGGVAYAQSKESDDRTLSPYFFVKSDEPGVEQLPLKSTSAKVNISGVIADVRVTQIYKNEGERPLEAIYVFPASTKVAVYGMKMIIGERIIDAMISKREEARREYKKAREQGKNASLLEQQGPNVFQMNVANIMPGDEINVELKYTELLVPTDRVYEFVYPTVAGPRYSNQPVQTASPSERWVQHPYLHQGQMPNYSFDIMITLAAGIPIREITCTSHKVSTTFEGPTMAMIRLDHSEHFGGNRDYILRYRLDGEHIQSGLLLYEGEHENFFLLMVQPPKRVTKREIPGREYIFVIDVSGSMHGFPIEMSKKLLKNLIGNLLPTDRFNVLLFSGGSSVMSEESVPAAPENIQNALNLIDRQQGSGGTELLPAFRRALALKKPEGYSRTIVIATDGYVRAEEELFDLIRNNLGDANVFPFGIGTAVNRHIIEGMARVGVGEPFIIAKPEEAPAKAEHLRTLIQSPVLTQVKICFQDFVTYDVEPISIPDVLAERPVIVFGKWCGQPRGKITLSGTSGRGPYRDMIDVQNMGPLKNNEALRYLWARHRIATLSDYNKLRRNDKRVKEVIELGLAYNLLTPYTSFVAVDTKVRNRTGQQTTVRQPLPIPQGVSDYAVGGAVGGVAVTGPFPLVASRSMREVREQSFLQDVAVKEKQKARGLRVGDITVSEGLSKDVVLNIAKKNIGEIERCCLRNELRGKLVLELIISLSGMVKTVKVISNPLKDRKAERCLIDLIKNWQFPTTQGGQEVKATITFILGAE
jgi:Ca-activated chloride channel family protein